MRYVAPFYPHDFKGMDRNSQIISHSHKYIQPCNYCSLEAVFQNNFLLIALYNVLVLLLILQIMKQALTAHMIKFWRFVI